MGNTNKKDPFTDNPFKDSTVPAPLLQATSVTKYIYYWVGSLETHTKTLGSRKIFALWWPGI